MIRFLAGFAALLGAGAALAGERYLVELADPPLAAYAGEPVTSNGVVKRFAATAPKAGGRLDPDSAGARAYLAHLAARQGELLGAHAKAASGARALRVVANALILELEADEVARLRADPRVRSVQRDQNSRLLTDAGPRWIGAEAVWNGTAPRTALRTRGEGAVIGILDSGIDAAHPAFSDPGEDGYDHTNPRGRFFGLCAAPRCNDKLIGIYDYTSEGARDGSDLDDHGTHVASTAAGNRVTAQIGGSSARITVSASGVAPRANLISYKVCSDTPDGTTCPHSAIMSALEQAIVDRVDVVNLSIGGDARDPWSTLRGPGNGVSLEEALLNTRAAGVLPVVAGGNAGPRAGSVTSPGNAPWVLTVANATHDRRVANRLGTVAFGGVAARDFVGVGLTGPLGERPIVHARDFGNALCGTGTTQGTTPNGASNPFPAGTFSGEIVICDRGIYARVEKGYNVLQSGAGGMILANTAADGESTVADEHFLPATHLGFADAVALETLRQQARAAGTTLRGSLSGLSALTSPSYGDVLSASSSRGPVTPFGGWLKPNVTAPGSSIIAANAREGGLRSMSGTSMAAPHVAGAAALLRAARPDLTLEQIESALLTTAVAGTRLEDGTRTASALGAGAGRADVAASLTAGLHFPVSRAEFVAMDPGAGADIGALNAPSLHDPACFARCSFRRTLVDNGSGGRWSVRFEGDALARATLSTTSVNLAPRGSATLDVEVDVSDPGLAGSWVSGAIVLTPDSAALAPQRVPVLVFADPGAAPADYTIGGSEDSGAVDVTLGGLAALANPRFLVSVPSPLRGDAATLGRDPGDEPYAENGVRATRVFPLPPFAVDFSPPPQGPFRTYLYAETESVSRDLDLYVGIDRNRDGIADAGEEVCRNEGFGGNLRCVVAQDVDLSAQAWVMVRNRMPANTAGDVIAIRFAAGYDPDSAASATLAQVPGRLHASGPGRVAAGASFPLRLSFSLPGVEPGGQYVSFLEIEAAAGARGRFGLAPVFVNASSSVQRRAQVLLPRRDLEVALGPNESHERIVFDVPQGATRVLVSATPQGTGEVELHLSRGTITPPDVAAAPPRAQAVASSVGAGQRTVVLEGAALAPGRWYATPVNRSGSVNRVRMTMSVTAPAPVLRETGYHHPARTGHGVFLSQGSVDWVAFWYTYGTDAQPTWYVAQARAPASGDAVWHAPLLRFTWDGARQNGSAVGTAAITRTGADRFTWSFDFDGRAGSEPMEPVAPSGCPQQGGAAVDYGGPWYAPVLPGYGYSVLTLANAEVQVAYLYDALGQPRWLYGQNDSLASGNFAMLQYRGFCPSCAYVPIAGQAAGTLTRRYDSLGTGGARLQANLLAPLAGGWLTDHSTAKLTRDVPCGP